MSEFLKSVPSQEQEEEPAPRFTPPIDHFSDSKAAVLAHKGKYFSSEELAALQASWTDPHERSRYIDMFFNKLRKAYLDQDDERIKVILEAFGAMITAAFPLHSGQLAGQVQGVEYGSGAGKIYLASGTSGQRVFLKDGEREFLGKGLFFYLSGQSVISRLPLGGLANLFGERLKHEPHEHDASEDVFLVIDGEETLQCPCGSRKIFKECHGA